jgi:ABC-2 type transport system ATP-binding protein
MPLFQASGIVKNYAGHKALDHVSISVPEKSIYGLLGPNGAGKTTLIRIINQITAPDEGTLSFLGRPMKEEDIHQIGYLPEERGLYKKMKVGEQALYLAQLKGLSRHEALKRLKHWFEKFEIESWWNKKVEELSKGMQQKVQFIVTIIHQPRLLIFDEPFTGFDPINTQMLKEEILNLRKEGATIIFSTHDMGSVEELCDHITLINQSRTLLEGPINEIREKYASNEYELRFEGDVNLLTATLNSRFSIMEHTKEGNLSILKIKLNNNGTPNDALRILLDSGKILSFNKITPGMNEIFIRVVSEAGEKEKEDIRESA